MKYENAKDVLPEALLAEIQNYVNGKLLYIPMSDNKKVWGEATGYRDKLRKRNIIIRNKYNHGVTISELAQEYYLSLDAIKKIIYSKKKEILLTYEATLASAVQYANEGLLDEWMELYRLFPGDNIFDIRGDDDNAPIYYGVVQLPLRLIHLADNVNYDDEKERMETERPLFVTYSNQRFYLNSNIQFYKMLKNRMINAYPAIIILNSIDNYNQFIKMYEKVLMYAK